MLRNSEPFIDFVRLNVLRYTYRTSILMRITILFFLLTCSHLLFSQDCCDTDSKLVICYTPIDEFCNPFNVYGCEYTLDGNFMDGIRKKLLNGANFGPNGISKCDVELSPLRNINISADIDSQQCDIVIIGAFGTINTEIERSFLPLVKDWSTKCEENLAIVFQGETIEWGYRIEDDNFNPNTPAAVVQPNIFDGAFGSLNSFNQGGSFQANFSVLPTTGAAILARDDRGRPTVVLDSLTNDILLADVGIVCNGAGDVSDSPNVNNSNDILACNILALGCEIASSSSLTEEDVFKCPDDDYTLPNGDVVVAEGVFVSNLLSLAGCDSTILTNIEFAINDPTQVEYVGCDGDGYIEQVDTVTFSQTNQTGSVLLYDQYGCDSLVEVNLSYLNHSDGFLDTLICSDGSFEYLGYSFNDAIDTTVIVQNLNGCDSIVDVNVNFIRINDVVIDSVITISNNADYTFNNTIPNTYRIDWAPTDGLSCSNCPRPVLRNTNDISEYTLTLTTSEGCQKDYSVSVKYVCEPYFPNVINASLSDEENSKFAAFAPCQLYDYNLKIFNRWGSLMFESEDPSEGWNGTSDNKLLTTGVYVYIMEYFDGNEVISKGGSITLLR